MEQGPQTAHQIFSKDAAYNSDASSCSNYLQASSGRISNAGSFNNGMSGNPSHGRSNMNLLDEMVGGVGVYNSLIRRSSKGSSRRNSGSISADVGDRILRSISLSRDLAGEILGNVDSSMIARVGDSGDRVMINEADDEKDSICVTIDHVRYVEDGFRSGSHLLPITPVPEEMKSPHPTDAMLHSTEKDLNQKIQDTSVKDNKYKLPQRLDYILYLIHLALFGILGVLTRYLLQKLFGPSLLALTGDNTPLYIDLPSNMLGSFLMGWFGIVFKPDICRISDHLAVGLSTGYLGSVTTFSGWNQKMLNLAAKGHWAFAVGGIILGMLIVNECIRVGVESGEGIRKSFSHKFSLPVTTGCCSDHWKVDSLKKHLIVMTILLVVLGSLWGLSGALAATKLDHATDGAILWLGCLVGPPGVWVRWYLARLNGQGFGRKGLLKWLPIGTLLANFLAACLMAALSTISKEVNTRRCTIVVSGVQLGFLGCMSTVSTFVSEVYAMRETRHRGRALAYVAATILPSFAMGTLIYSVPVWTKHYT